MNVWQRFTRWMAAPVDGGSLAAMRIFVGLVTALEAVSLLRPQGNTSIVELLYTSPRVNWHFSYPGLSWIQPLADPWMSLAILLMGVSGVAVAAGFLYRPATIVAFLLRSYVFLIDAANYNNHYYLECLLLLYLIFIPADRCWSVDARNKAATLPEGDAPSRWVPFWGVFLFRAQLFIVYFYGGLTKLNAPYLNAAEPMRSVANSPAVLAPYRPYLSAETFDWLRELLARPQTAYFLSYAGLAFDLTVGFLLVFRRTRFLGFMLTVVFHALNHFLFFDDIGWFPLLGVLSALIFFAPDWPTRLWNVVRKPKVPWPDWSWFFAGAIAIPGIGAALGWQPKPSGIQPAPAAPVSRWPVSTILVCWLVLQCVWPLRHLAIAGPVIWTEEGGLFSWRMKSSLKLSQFPTFYVDDPSLQTTGENGKPEIDWFSYSGEQIVYENLNPGNVDWSKLPEVIVEFVPLYGERILINPFAGGREVPMTTLEAGQRAKDLWNEKFRRVLPDESLYQTGSVPVQLGYLERRLRELKASPAMIERAQRARSLYAALLRTPPNSAERVATYNQFRETLRDLAADPQHGRQAGAVFSVIHPLALWGAPDPSTPFVRVADITLQRDLGDGVVRLNHDELRPLLLSPQTVYVPMGQLYTADWTALPLVHVRREPERGTLFVWNPYADLVNWQILNMLKNPLMIHQYAQHVADRWEQQFESRPGVRVLYLSSIPPEPWRLVIDPEVDLTTAERHYLSHNEWITMPDSPTANPTAAPAASAQPTAKPAAENP
ncbi:MAG: HTTM domain-containing protein [Pirellulales bacterium]|nr:HTTM domain-containing protein [Pirellulales bacterium]